jgi:hypothetical protein
MEVILYKFLELNINSQLLSDVYLHDREYHP